jgi:hypothetical protein
MGFLGPGRPQRSAIRSDVAANGLVIGRIPAKLLGLGFCVWSGITQREKWTI